MLRTVNVLVLAGIVSMLGCGGQIPLSTNPLSAEDKAKLRQHDQQVDSAEGRKVPAKKAKKGP